MNLFTALVKFQKVLFESTMCHIFTISYLILLIMIYTQGPGIWIHLRLHTPTHPLDPAHLLRDPRINPEGTSNLRRHSATCLLHTGNRFLQYNFSLTCGLEESYVTQDAQLLQSHLFRKYNNACLGIEDINQTL